MTANRNPQTKTEHGPGRASAALWRCVPPLMGTLALVALLVTGCQDEVKRYETLSFFFDGVPPPAGYDLPPQPQPLIGPWGVQIDPRSELGQQMLAKRQAQPTAAGTDEAEQVFFYHTPYKNRDCFGCHDQAQGYTPPAAGAMLCNKCHASYTQFEQDDWVHGPVVVGQCGWCHESHKSEQPSLTREAQPALCMSCHDQAFIDHDPFHAGMRDPNCTDCHDPHASGNRLLLADSRTYQRRAKTMALLPSPHAGWPKDLCSSCHVPERSNQLTEDVDATCVSCHEISKLAGMGEPKPHEAVVDGKCTTCHLPHRSTMPHLLRADAQKKCYACHKPEEGRTATHPDVTRVDCLLCHAGHGSARPALLRPGIPIPAVGAEPGGEP